MSLSVKQIIAELESLADPADARHSLRYFKTGPGEYGEGDRFLGIRVPTLRRVARKWKTVPLEDAVTLLHSPWHEVRLVALLILVAAYRTAPTEKDREAVYRAYLKNAVWINNWDLVDVSAEHVVGAHLFERDRSELFRMVRSRNLWKRRIAIIATFHFIRRGDFACTLELAERLLADPEDLLHKATGWMLREVEKRDGAAARAFLDAHHARMPRTMLRYAIERMPEPERKAWLGRSGKKSSIQ
jgi:3-methyladenine DNA glycosylase AlkD